MKRSSDVERKQDIVADVADALAQQSVESEFDWRRLDVRRPGDEAKWPAARRAA